MNKIDINDDDVMYCEKRGDMFYGKAFIAVKFMGRIHASISKHGAVPLAWSSFHSSRLL